MLPIIRGLMRSNVRPLLANRTPRTPLTLTRMHHTRTRPPVTLSTNITLSTPSLYDSCLRRSLSLLPLVQSRGFTSQQFSNAGLSSTHSDVRRSAACADGIRPGHTNPYGIDDHYFDETVKAVKAFLNLSDFEIIIVPTETVAERVLIEVFTNGGNQAALVSEQINCSMSESYSYKVDMSEENDPLKEKLDPKTVVSVTQSLLNDVHKITPQMVLIKQPLCEEPYTKEELLDLCHESHRIGLKVVLDLTKRVPISLYSELKDIPADGMIFSLQRQGGPNNTIIILNGKESKKRKTQALEVVKRLGALQSKPRFGGSWATMLDGGQDALIYKTFARSSFVNGETAKLLKESGFTVRNSINARHIMILLDDSMRCILEQEVGFNMKQYYFSDNQFSKLVIPWDVTIENLQNLQKAIIRSALKGGLIDRKKTDSLMNQLTINLPTIPQIKRQVTYAQEMRPQSFASDTHSTMHPAILQSILDLQDSKHLNPEVFIKETEQAIREFTEHPSPKVIITSTTTGANKYLVEAGTTIVGPAMCSQRSHFNTFEVAQNKITIKKSGKITPEIIESTCRDWALRKQGTKPRMVWLDQPNVGDPYTPEEVKAICDKAHQLGMTVGMDTERIVSVMAATGVSYADYTWKAGVDFCAMGSTKNGGPVSSLCIFFSEKAKRQFDKCKEYAQERGGILPQAESFGSYKIMLEGGKNSIHLTNARQANAHANHIFSFLKNFEGIRYPDYELQSNMIFVKLPQKVLEKLREKGPEYEGLMQDRSGFVRIVCSYDLTEETVTQFLADFEEVYRSEEK